MSADRVRASASTDAVVDALDRALCAAGDPERADQEKAYLKSPIEHYGASVPAIRRAVKITLEAAGDLPRGRLLELARALWASPVHEQRMAAVILLEECTDTLKPADLALVERMIRESFTWAYVDTLAASVAGPLVQRHPDLADALDRWAAHESFWLRRSALLALLLPIRSGSGDWRRFKRYADSMLDEKEFFIRKAIGWVLREASKKRPERVRRYVASRVGRMSGLTFREAIRRLPAEDQEALRAAYEGARAGAAGP
jgi:3-methyladenine DNA glycosylase AlkD